MRCHCKRADLFTGLYKYVTTGLSPYLFSGMEAAYRGRVNCMYDGGLDDEDEVEDGLSGVGGDGELLQEIPDVRPHCLIKAPAPVLIRP